MCNRMRARDYFHRIERTCSVCICEWGRGIFALGAMANIVFYVPRTSYTYRLYCIFFREREREREKLEENERLLAASDASEEKKTRIIIIIIFPY